MQTPDHIDRAALVVDAAIPNEVSGMRHRHAQAAVRALDKAGLLAAPERAEAGIDYDADTTAVLQAVRAERTRQVARYGRNTALEDGSGPATRWLLPYTSHSAADVEQELRADYEDYEEDTGAPTWVHLVREEVAEAFAESDPQRLEEELVQVAALCVSWVETLRRR